jgi:hypothetical protein
MGLAKRTVDVELVRVAAEREAKALLRDDGLHPQTDYAPQDVAGARRALLEHALPLTETMAPAAYAAAHEVMAALGRNDAIELFQSKGGGTDNACLVLHGNPVGVMFLGGYLGTLDRGSLLAVLGHEVGHAIAHYGEPKDVWASHASRNANTRNKRAYAMATELTADRFGLLACADLESVLRLEMLSIAGGRVSGISLDAMGYLAQCRTVSEETLARGDIALGSTHPEHSIRAYAAWLFSQSDVYATITGAGSPSRPIAEVESIVRKLIGLHELPAPAPAVRRSTGTAPPDLRARFEEHVRQSRLRQTSR